MTPADAKIVANDLIALSALTNSSYVSNHWIQEAARLAGIVLDLATQLEAAEAEVATKTLMITGTGASVTFDQTAVDNLKEFEKPRVPTTKKRRGRSTQRQRT